MEIEAGFKIKESREDAEKILLSAGFVNTYKTAKTKDVYFGKNVNLEGKDETGIKNSLIRLRNFETFENLNLLDSNIAEFKRLDKTRFTRDNFIEDIDFDYLEIHVIEE